MTTLPLIFTLAVGRLTQETPKQMDLSEVIKQAIASSTEVRSAKNSLKSARSRIGQQASYGKLQIGISGAATRYDDKTMIALGASPPIEVLPDHQESLSLELRQVLDFSGQIGAMVSQSKLLAMSAEYSLKSTSDDQALTATIAYYNFLRAEHNVKVAQASLEAYQEQFKTTTKLWEGGVGQKIDVYRANSQVAAAERELVRRKNELDASRSALNDRIGLPLDKDLKLVDETPIDVKGALTAPATTIEERQSLIKRALDHRDEALAAHVEVAAAQKGIKIARASSEPTVSIALGGNYYPTESFQTPRRTVGALTVNVSIPISDGGLSRERTKEADATVDSAKAKEDRVRRDIALQVQNASLDVSTALKSLDAANAALEAAVAARKLAQLRYQSQVGLYIEVTDAQAALSAAEAAQVDATYDLLIAKARLSRALNEPIVK